MVRRGGISVRIMNTIIVGAYRIRPFYFHLLRIIRNPFLTTFQSRRLGQERIPAPAKSNYNNKTFIRNYNSRIAFYCLQKYLGRSLERPIVCVVIKESAFAVKKGATSTIPFSWYR